MDAFDLERCGNTTMSLAVAQSAFDYVLNYSQEREQFGKPLVDFQAVQIQLAEMKMKLKLRGCCFTGQWSMPNQACRLLEKAQLPNASQTKQCEK